jgi:2-polyprenyl-3-methyl-5-hydroxy-6-metoxy-1,4-benzoquinol methylase
VAASRYSREIDLEQTNDAHSLGILSVPRGSVVLDVGAAAGDVARVLRERGCAVTGIEVDERAASAAEKYVDCIIVGDVEQMDIAAALEDKRFDVVLCLDVLEHLREPARVLAQLASLLEPGGRVVASIPNVAHAAVRLELLQGHFRYRRTGLLDSTHVRFFDADAVEALFRDAGLVIDERLHVTRRLEETEFEIDVEALPPDVLSAATSGPDALTYQFVVTARRAIDAAVVPRVTGQDSTLAERLQRELEERRIVYDDAVAYARHLEGVVAQTATLEARVVELEAVLAERMEEYHQSADAQRQLENDIAIKDAYIAELRVQAARANELDEVWRILREHQERERSYHEQITELNAATAEFGRLKYRIADRIDAVLSHIPLVHDGLRRAGTWLSGK